MFSRLEKAAIARLTGGGGGEESSFFPTKESGTVLIKNYVPPPQLYFPRWWKCILSLTPLSTNLSQIKNKNCGVGRLFSSSKEPPTLHKTVNCNCVDYKHGVWAEFQLPPLHRKMFSLNGYGIFFFGRQRAKMTIWVLRLSPCIYLTSVWKDVGKVWLQNVGWNTKSPPIAGKF